MSWKAAMGLVVIEGLIILVLVLTGFRTAVFRAVPSFLKRAMAVGIGPFLAIALLALKVRGALLLSIIGATIVAFIVEAVGDLGPFKDATGAVVNDGGWALVVPSAPDALTAVGAEAGLNDENETSQNSKEILVVDSRAAVAGGVASTSSNTSYIESAS